MVVWKSTEICKRVTVSESEGFEAGIGTLVRGG